MSKTLDIEGFKLSKLGSYVGSCEVGEIVDRKILRSYTIWGKKNTLVY